MRSADSFSVYVTFFISTLDIWISLPIARRLMGSCRLKISVTEMIESDKKEDEALYLLHCRVFLL